MKAVVLGAGRGTRLRPLTYFINKILLPVGDRPIVWHIAERIKELGITEIGLVVREVERDWFHKKVTYIEDELSIRITVIANDKWATAGMAGAVYAAKDYVAGDDFIVIAGDNLYTENLSSTISKFKKGAMLHRMWVEDPSRFGVGTFDEKDPEKIVGIVEKPANPPSNWALVAPYVFDNRAFSYIEELKPSARGEYEITDLCQKYLDSGELVAPELPGKIVDIGTFESLYEANQMFAGKLKQE